MLSRVESTLRSAGLLEDSGCALVVAVSGGPDSMALLGLLHHLAEKYPLRLYGAHLNHGLRGVESDQDAEYVGEACQGLSIPATIEKADVTALRARHRLSWEAAAREARYDFLARVSLKVGARAVALGHTADDQAETVLLHLLRGTGIRGLRGMLPLSVWRSLDGERDASLVRPLLNATRQETEEYCASHRLIPRYDSSNLQDRFMRNRIRRHLMPQLSKYNPAVRQALVRLATTAAQDVAYMDQQVQEVWPEVVTPEPWGMRLLRPRFNTLHPSLRAHILLRAYIEVAGEASDLNMAQVEGMCRLAEQGAGRSLSLGHSVRFSTSSQELMLAREPPQPPWPSLREMQELAVPSEICAEGWRILLRRLAAPQAASNLVQHDPFRAHLSLEAVGQRLWVRNRKAGDRFQPLGISETKKLKEFMIGAHVPRAWRESVPLVVAEAGIAWVVGCRIAQWARVTPETREVVEVTFSREK